MTRKEAIESIMGAYSTVADEFCSSDAERKERDDEMRAALLGIGVSGKEVDAIIAEETASQKSFQQEIQRHHDHYVKLFREGRLAEEDRPQYELAMKREQMAEVKPLDEASEEALNLLWSNED